MKRSFSILLTLLLVSVAINVHAAGDNLEPGKYQLFAYSTSNGNTALSTSKNSSVNAGFQNLSIAPQLMDTVLNRETNFSGTPVRPVDNGNYHGFAIKAAYAPTSAITIHSSVALTDITDKEHIDYTDRVGWEVDLGVAYKFMNKFAYEVHFGYMDTGELFKESTSFTDVESIGIISNKLTMSF